jgi:hypothetical protein
MGRAEDLIKAAQPSQGHPLLQPVEVCQASRYRTQQRTRHRDGSRLTMSSTSDHPARCRCQQALHQPVGKEPASTLILRLTSRALAAGPGPVDRSDAACQAAVTTATSIMR